MSVSKRRAEGLGRSRLQYISDDSRPTVLPDGYWAFAAQKVPGLAAAATETPAPANPNATATATATSVAAGLSGPSIIPSPGPPPSVAPITASIQIDGTGYTIAAGTQIYAVGLANVLTGWNSTITNNGVVWLESNGVHAWFATGGRPQILNNGLIYIRGRSQVELSPLGDHLVNTGSIFAVSTSGWARVISSDVYPVFVENSGLIAAQSLGIDDTPNPVYEDVWNATAIDASGQLQVINHATGRILAEAPHMAIGIFSPSGDREPGKPVVTNMGLIEANATSAGGTSIGIYIAQPGHAPATIVNSGTIRADIAIFGTYSGEPLLKPVEYVENRAGGVIQGLVYLDIGDDRFVNDGAVIGNVDMGGGSDVFSGSGTVSGVVDMGFDADTYSGSGANDRATGGRGDDILRGNDGHDLLLGGFGNDTLRGDGGNDGLIGEWGDDTIETLGGDYVEGGAGNDRVVLGDYGFQAVHGNEGTDTLVLADGARNFSLADMVAGGRVSGFEIIELKSGQQLALSSAAIAALGGGQTLRVVAAAGNTIHLDGNWTRGADASVNGALYEVWTQGDTTVMVTETATVTPSSAPSFGGLDAVAGGGEAPRPGAAAGLDYTDPSHHLSRFPLGSGEFTVASEEVFYSDGTSVFYRPTPVASPAPRLTFTNNGAIYSLGVAEADTWGWAWGLEFYSPVTVINNGLIYVELLAPKAPVLYYPSFAVWMTWANAGETRLENYNEIGVYSESGSAIAVNNASVFRNTGLISAVSETSRAIAVNGVLGSHFIDNSQTFWNSGLIYAQAGGAGRRFPQFGDRIVPENIAATGVMAGNSLTNDGDIIAKFVWNPPPPPPPLPTPPGTPPVPTPPPPPPPQAITVGVYIVNQYLNGTPHRAGVTNNGTIEGTIAIKFEENFSADFSHWVVNNGLLIGHVQFENGADEYDGSRGEIRGTVFGYGGADRFLGGKFGDSFDGGADSDTLDGGGGTDWLSGGDGNDTIIGGAGIDRLSGGLGSDLFVYKSIADSRSYLLLEDGTKEMPDIIRDFQSGLDKIDLSAIDAIAGTSADDSFTFIGSAAFSNRAGELRVVIEYGAANIYADVDGDGVADMQISLLGNTPIAADFIL